jgi:ankyrin repeat protein
MNRKLTVIILLWALTAIAQTAFAYQTERQKGAQKGAKMKQEFFKAITQGEAAQVKEMLTADPQLAAAKNGQGLSAVLLATYSRKPEVVAVLLATGVALNIFEAAATGQTERVCALVKQDATLVNAYAPDGFFPLGLAVFFGHQPTVEALLTAGAEVNAASRESMQVTPLHSAVAAGQLDIARVLLAHGAHVNARNGAGGFTPLHEAAASGHLEFAKLLLAHKADLNAKTKDGKTPLAFALSRRQSEMATFLRERGATQ